jgi:type VI secretion system FHA domain protein
MKLRLLLRGPGRLLSAIPDKTLESGHLIIGRSSEADWMIPDPDRVISKAHCRIDATERGFMLTDTSTNGMRINNIPVGQGLPSLLSDGDVLTLGDAIIGVEILATTRAAATSIANEKPAGEPVVTEPAAIAEVPIAMRPRNPFPDGPFGFDSAASGPSPVAGLETEQPLEQPVGKEPVQQDWWDPNAASGKPGLPLSADVVIGAAGNESAFPISEQASALSESNEVQALEKTAGSVEMQRLLQAVATAAQVLAKDEREKFERRLREILQLETVHGQ